MNEKYKEESQESTPKEFGYKLKLARFLLTFYAALPLAFLKDYQSVQALAFLVGIAAYLVVTLSVCFSSLIVKSTTRKFILCLDALILGIISWMTASVVYGIESLGLLVISAAITCRFKSLSTALLFASIGAVGTWYATPILELPQVIRWEYNLPAMVCTALLVAYAVLFLNQQAEKITKAEDEYAELEAKQVEQKFKLYQVSKYMSPTLRNKLSKPREIEPGTVRKRLTIFFSDLVGFTKMSEEMDPSDLNYILNGYVTEMSTVAIEYGATIDKFMGDGMMAFFGDPSSKGTKEDAVRCISMALEMQRRMPKLRAKWREHGINADLHIRMGINSGFTTVGNFGSNDRLDYTCLGAEVNLASRLESNAKIDSIYISSSTHILVHEKFECESRGDITVKGFSEPVPVFEVIASRGSSKEQKSYANHSMDGFELYLDLQAMPNYNKKKVHEALVDAATKLKNWHKS